jgi:transcriptional regulator with XRE-family HTH domain
MLIGQKLREIREAKNLSQGDIERRTGLLRCYTSRVENGHTVPSVETLEKYARALEVPLYRLFHDGDRPVQKLVLAPGGKGGDSPSMSKKERRELRLFANSLSRMSERHRRLLFAMAQQLANQKKKEDDARG